MAGRTALESKLGQGGNDDGVDGGWRVVDCAADHCYRKAAAKLSVGRGSCRLLDHETELPVVLSTFVIPSELKRV